MTTPPPLPIMPTSLAVLAVFIVAARVSSRVLPLRYRLTQLGELILPSAYLPLT